MKKSEIIFGVLRIPVDFAMIALAFFTAYFIRQSHDLIPYYEQTPDLSSFPDPATYTNTVTVFGIVLLILLVIYKSYSFKIYNTYSREGKSILHAWLTWVGLILLYYFIIRDFPFSRLVIIFGWGGSFIFLLFGRALIKAIQKLLLKYDIGRRRIVIVGYNQLAKKILPQFVKDSQYQVVGIVNQRKIQDLKLKKRKIKFLGKIDELKRIIKRYRIDEIIQTDTSIDVQNLEITDLCREMHIQHHFIPDQIQLHRTKIDIQIINNCPVISVKATPLEGWGKVNKRIFDVLFSTLALLVLSPFIILVSIIIKIDSHGPIFFTRLDNGFPVLRVGEKGRLFKFYKFRSMQDKSHGLRYTHLAEKSKRKGPFFKITDDPRITRVGKFIRKYDIDEWPNFWSVLKGDMGIVGPRPHLPDEVEKYDKHHRFVLSIKPGITGLAQVSGRSNLSAEEEMNLDTFYIENWSLWLDVKICFQTIWVIIRGKGE
ncbi:sugar transferase [Candidatus Peregrinibacteria bacterium]|jgi:exopolysaccharide biosynthesis polyprenyl glycosylphosphotransferase|nr:sugar transferase [Candidatus Peregrinibacteria bacterium]